MKEKDKWVVLLGAGAGVEAGLPTSNELTKKALADARAGEDPRGDYIDAYRYVADILRERRRALWGDERHGDLNPDELNVEDLAEALLTLEDRQTLPFTALFGPISDDLLQLELAGNKAYKAAARKPHHFLGPDFDKPAGFFGRAYIELRNFCLTALWENDRRKDVGAGYLKPLAASEKIGCVASLNYDSLFESACLLAGRRVDYGVAGWAEAPAVLFEKGNRSSFRLYPLPFFKLHGSANWMYQFKTYARVDPLTSESRLVFSGDFAIEESPAFPSMAQPAVLFGTKNKLTMQSPFPILFHRFREELGRVSKTAVIGYSFGDSHINQILVDWLAENHERKLHVANGASFVPAMPKNRVEEAFWNRVDEDRQIKASEFIAKTFCEA